MSQTTDGAPPSQRMRQWATPTRVELNSPFPGLPNLRGVVGVTPLEWSS